MELSNAELLRVIVSSSKGVQWIKGHWLKFSLVRFVNLVCLPNAVPAPTEGTKCWITGWGRSQSVGGSSPNVLQQASVPIVGRNRCEWAYLGRIHDSMICAGLDRGGIDSCQGDSGGPMVCESGGRFYLQGVTSWGQGCARPNKYGVYARVKYVIDWLNKEMKGNSWMYVSNKRGLEPRSRKTERAAYGYRR